MSRPTTTDPIPPWEARREDIRRNGIKDPIPIDYGQDPPKVLDGYTRLSVAHQLGLKVVPVPIRRGRRGPSESLYTSPGT